MRPRRVFNIEPRRFCRRIVCHLRGRLADKWLNEHPMKVERKTDITVLKGMEWRLGRPNFWRWLAGLPGPRRRLPKAAADAALTFRTAVIQHSFVSGLDDMFHDAALWRAIVAFVRDFEGGGEVSVCRDVRRRSAMISLAEYQSEMDAFTPEDESDAPRTGALFLRQKGSLRLYVEPENWSAIGGPAPYHDSCTYSIYADKDITAELVSRLKESPGASGWRFADFFSVDGINNSLPAGVLGLN